MAIKKRIDILVHEAGLAESREKAKALVMEGKVYVDNQKADKPGMLYSEDVLIELKGDTIPFVSRGGLKLAKAIDIFNIDLSGKIAMDVGASTGGFTDCMLQNGAKKVYSVDVGYGQLAWKLRNDSRVINMERTNARNISSEDINDRLDFASVDVSFISLTKIIPVLCNLMDKDFGLLCLIKPQFEAGKSKVGKNGVVREKSTHIEVIEHIVKFCIDMGLGIEGLDFSPIKGPKGNIEYLIYLKNAQSKQILDDILPLVHSTVEKSHLELD